MGNALLLINVDGGLVIKEGLIKTGIHRDRATVYFADQAARLHFGQVAPHRGR